MLTSTITSTQRTIFEFMYIYVLGCAYSTDNKKSRSTIKSHAQL